MARSMNASLKQSTCCSMEFLESWPGNCEELLLWNLIRSPTSPQLYVSLQFWFHDKSWWFGECMFFFRRSHRFRTRSSMDSPWPKRLFHGGAQGFPAYVCMFHLQVKLVLRVWCMYICTYISHGLIYAYWTMNIKTWSSLHVCVYVSVCLHV